MTQDEIIELATEAGLCSASNGFVDWIDAGPSLHEMTLFAKLLAEKEREACANIANSKRYAPNFQLTSWPPQNGTAFDIENLIRARGQA